MKEYTVTMNAQLTFVTKVDDDHFGEEEIAGITEKDYGALISAVFDLANVRLDDVVVSDLKMFMREEGEEHVVS